MNEYVISFEEYNRLKRDSILLQDFLKERELPIVVQDTGGKVDSHGFPEYLVVGKSESNRPHTVAYKRTDPK